MNKPDLFLITRFNVPISNWDKDKAGTPTLDTSWMNHRMALFKTYCVPSIAGQTDKDFTWLIYCDPHTPAHFVESIQSSLALVPNAQLRFVSDFNALKTDLKQLISSGNTPYVITARVDNDDALGTNYIEAIQANFVPEDRTIINLAGGALYDLLNRVLTKLPDMRLNHFGSLIEKRNSSGDYLTVMGFSHHEPPSGVNVKDVTGKYAWLKIIHDRNVNSKTIGVPLFSSNLTRHFSLGKNAMPVSLMNTLSYLIHRGIAVLKRKISPHDL